MTQADDTQPKAPTGVHKAIHAQPLQQQQQPPPPPPTDSPGLLNACMMLGVMGAAMSLCLVITGLFGVAGAQDEYQALGTQAEADEAAEVSTQYARAMDDLAAGNADLARERLTYIETLRPGYQDAAAQLAAAEATLAVTPTPSTTPTPETDTPTPAAEDAPPQDDAPPPPSNTPVPDDDGVPNTPEELFAQAQTAMNVGLYEDAIAWFDALVLLDPSYRRVEVREQRLDAYVSQGMLYLRGQNDDGEDRLAQGVQLINRASELGNVSPEIIYEADFVARYLAARAYVEGEAFGQARQVLTRLCEENCDWSYRGVSVRDLLAQAGGG